MLRSAPLLRRGVLLIRGPNYATEVWVPALRSSAKRAAPRSGHEAYFPVHFGGRFSENAFGPSI
jgi:hypothetical protein